jgi:hypothetical protein
MTQVRTDYGTTVESARRLHAEKVGALPGTNVQVDLQNLDSRVTTITAPTQRLVTSSPITVQSTDFIINVNISAGSPSCTLPLASSRAGIPLVFVDVGGNFGAHALTITPAGGDTIDGQASLSLGTNRQAIRLVPANDGTTTGWTIQ